LAFFTILKIHSWTRWFVLASTAATALAGGWGWRKALPYTQGFRRLAWVSVWATSFQSALGFALYFYYDGYPKTFWRAPAAALENPEVRFFGLIHGLSMFLGIGLIHWGAARARKSQDPALSHHRLLVSHGLALMLMLLALPWFRPWWR
jgi:hypothetical protein